MLSENKEKPFDLGPILPMFGAGVDLGERLGAMDSRLKQLESGQARLEIKIEAGDARLEAKIDAQDTKIDKMAYALNRLDERTQMQGKILMTLGGGTLAAVIAGFLLQFLTN